MSDEQDSWFKSAFGVDLGQAAQGIKDEASAAMGQAASTVTQVVQGVQGVVEGAIGTVTGAVTGAAKKVAGAVSGSPGAGGASGGGTGSFPLGGSVGRGGRNAANDVKAVQGALGIGVDGQCGGQTIAAIEAFQRNMGVAKPDGRVDAGGATERAMAGGAKPAPAAPPAAPDAADDGGLLGGLKSLGSQLLGDVSNPGALLQGVGSLGGEGPFSGSLGPLGGLFGKLPLLKKLSPDEAAACQKFLADHRFDAEPEDRSKPATAIEHYVPVLDGRRTTIGEVVDRLGPLTVLNPVGELRELVMERYRPLVNAQISPAGPNLNLPPSAFGVQAGPSTLIAKAGKGRIKLLWSAVRGARLYGVYRSEVSGAFGRQPLRAVSATRFMDTGVSNGTTYFYYVSANPGVGESAASPEASATPVAQSSPQAEAELDGDVKTKVKWDIGFKAHDDAAHFQTLPSAELEVEVDETGNVGPVEVQLNVIKGKLETSLRLVGKVEIEATAKLVIKGALGDRILQSVEGEVKGEVEIKLKHIALKASAAVNPHGHVEPGFAIVLWRF